MKAYIKLLSVILVFVFTLGAAGLGSASAEEEYVKPDKFIYGDVNQDGGVNVKDVTYIQKGLAEIHYVNAVQRFLADPEGEGFSIKNATAIQKYLAKYEVSPLLGTELPMASQDEFSNAVWDIDTYDGEKISVHPLSNFELSYEYTLEDFPEYSFNRIERKSLSQGKYIYYNLYLTEPSQENALEAIKFLDYRANIDLHCVELDYYIPIS